MNKKIYDKLLVESLIESDFCWLNNGGRERLNNHLKDTLYFDDEYCEKLKEHLREDGYLEKYSLELGKNSKGTKMCSIASSSRLCYLFSKNIKNKISEVEKTDIVNGCCRPHYDAYSKEDNIFYEFKCHEICDRSHGRKLSKQYIGLLNEVFGINTKNPAELTFGDFGLDYSKDSSIYNTYFDFKQFICHILGLLKVANENNKPTLYYYIVIPRWRIEPYGNNNQKKLDLFLSEFDSQIRTIIGEFNEIKVNFNRRKKKIKNIINIEYQYCWIDFIHDEVLNSLQSDKDLLFNYTDENKCKENDANFVEAEKVLDCISNINPFNVDINGNKPRERKDIINYLGERKDSINFRGKTFDELRTRKAEHLIQRHLLYANKLGLYKNIFGEILGYEVPTVYEKYPGGIDILSYKDGKLMIVELKDCQLYDDKEVKSESSLRAIYEITTYYAFFKSQMDKEDYGNTIKKRILNNNPTIEKVVIVPNKMAKKLLEHQELIKDIKVISIERKEDVSKYRIDEAKELFDLKVLYNPNLK